MWQFVMWWQACRWKIYDDTRRQCTMKRTSWLEQQQCQQQQQRELVLVTMNHPLHHPALLRKSPLYLRFRTWKIPACELRCVPCTSKLSRWVFVVTSSDICQFLVCFCWYTWQYVCNNVVMKDPTRPLMCRYTTLWIVNAWNLACSVYHYSVAEMWSHLRLA